ncbi:MAG TPA: hypothetical protein VF051_00910 [Hyphomicrobiaceae bacterium]
MTTRLYYIAAALLLAAPQASAQSALMSRDAQIAAAVAPLPEEFRAQAVVLGYVAGSQTLTELRRGSGPFHCLADDPADERFHVACYHSSLEPFMARGRALRAQGVTGAAVDSARFAEIKAGTLLMPTEPAALYSLTVALTGVNAATGELTGARPLYVVYIPFATSELTGLPKTPAGNLPWLMFPGTPKAHIMFVPTM